MNRFHSTLLTTLIVCLVITTFPTLAQANAAVGEVLLSIGKNVAVASDGQIRPLKRKSELFEGDRIETAPRGRIQIRFSDGSLLSLKAATQFQVEQYQFDPKAPDEGEAVYQLLKGGMRTVTGLIGRNQKQDYRLETPVATIGIRGTHYSLQLCDAACAALTNQPQGLFGGVTQGGLQVGNDSGSYAIGVNDYFHVPDRFTPLTPLLHPPQLLDEESPDTEAQEQEETNRQKENGTESQPEVMTEANDEQPDTPITLEASLTELGSFASTTENITEPLNTATADPLAESQLPALDPEKNDPPRSDPDTTNGGTNGVAAPDNAAVGIAFTSTNATFGVEPMSGSFVTGGGNSALLDSNNTLLSFGVVDPQAVEGGEGCNPCLFNAGSATLSNVGGASGAGIGINWGRWTLGWSVTENGNALPHTDQFHYIYSPNRSSESLVRGLSGVYQFDFIGGTLPSDEQDNLGTLPSGTILVDFDHEMVLGITLNVQVGNRTIVANQLHTLTPLDQLLFADGPGVPLIGTCRSVSGDCGTGEVRGDFNLSFVGDGAERIMGSWGLMEDTPSQVSSFSLVGVSAYAQGTTALAPSSFRFANPGSTLNLATIHSDGPGQHKGRALQINADVNTAIVVDTIDAIPDTPIYTHFETQDGNGNITCANCEISSGRATLQDTGALIEAGQQVNWGRWEGQWAATSNDPDTLRPFDALHYIFSENTTPDNVVRNLTGSMTYFRTDGTQPTDHQGNVGSYGSANSINVDFSRQMVISAVMDLSVGGRTILMNEQNPVPIEDLLSNQPIPLVGSCSGSDCNTSTAMVGAMGVDFVGSNAERLITSYGLSDDSASPSIAVTGTGVYQDIAIGQ